MPRLLEPPKVSPVRTQSNSIQGWLSRPSWWGTMRMALWPILALNVLHGVLWIRPRQGVHLALQLVTSFTDRCGKAIAWQAGTLMVEKCLSFLYVNGVLYDIFPINIIYPKNHVHIILGSHGLLPLRVILLMILVVCMNGTILLEQPSNSFVEYYPRFRDVLQLLQNIGGPNTVPCPGQDTAPE